ncbi:MAG: polymer-forming cytoskeletal protein [Proteobacteria bacterium]|nr:polymer-forming cytoskeletal protein [Pseudomonadota bacterium]
MFRKKKEGEETIKPSVSTSSQSAAHQMVGSQAVAGSRSGVGMTATPSAPAECAEDIIARRFGKPRSALGPGTVIQGKLSFDTIVVIEGKLGGEVYSTETLIVGKQGTVQAQVRAKNLVVAGMVSGNVAATDSIEILRGGRIEGEFTAKRLIIEDGAVFNGSFHMGGELTKAASAQIAAAQKSAEAAVQAAAAITKRIQVEHPLNGGGAKGAPSSAAISSTTENGVSATA